MSDNYLYPRRMHELWSKAVELYRDGGRDPGAFFNQEESRFMASIGATAMDFFDFAEDFNSDGEPDWETFLLIQAVRRDYFFEVQNGEFSSGRVEENELPAREAEAGGMPWLPRLIAKARAKLRGELTPEIMYCCGGDRKFFRTHDIHPADFLRATWELENDEAALVQWTAGRSRMEVR